MQVLGLGFGSGLTGLRGRVLDFGLGGLEKKKAQTGLDFGPRPNKRLK